MENVDQLHIGGLSHEPSRAQFSEEYPTSWPKARLKHHKMASCSLLISTIQQRTTPIQQTPPPAQDPPADIVQLDSSLEERTSTSPSSIFLSFPSGAPNVSNMRCWSIRMYKRIRLKLAQRKCPSSGVLMAARCEKISVLAAGPGPCQGHLLGWPRMRGR